MILQCPRCRTKWQLDESLLGEDGSTVRCSRCGHEFLAFPPPPVDGGGELDEPGDTGDLGGFLDDGPDLDDLDELSESKSGAGRTIFMIILILIIVLGLALGGVLFMKGRGVHLDRQYLGFDLYSVMPSFLKPAETKAPAGAKATAASVTRIQMDNDAYVYKNSERAGQMLVITGRATNTNDRTVSEIKLRGFLHTKDKRNALSKTVYAGNVLSDQELNDNTPEVIDQLLLNPMGQKKANVNIAPGGEVDFMIVFFNLPPNLTNYTVEVIGLKDSPGSGDKQ